MTRVIARIRRWYGAHPLHLLALLAAFALAGYAVRAVVAAGQWQVYALWFLVAIVGHDLLLFPLYSLADLSLRRLLPWREGGASTAPNRVAYPLPPVINHLRVPAGFSLLLLLVWFPLILRLSSSAYHRASGLTAAPYLWRWLAVTGVMFLASAVGYALRLRHAAVKTRKPGSHAGLARRQEPVLPSGRIPLDWKNAGGAGPVARQYGTWPGSGLFLKCQVSALGGPADHVAPSRSCTSAPAPAGRWPRCVVAAASLVPALDDVPAGRRRLVGSDPAAAVGFVNGLRRCLRPAGQGPPSAA